MGEEEEEDYFTRTTKDPNLVKCERVNPKKKKNISAEIQLDSRGLRDQFDSGQMMGNYSTKIDERAKEIEEMRKLKADGIKDVWESQPVALEGVVRASEQQSDDFLMEAGRGDKAYNSRMIRNEFNRKAKGLTGPGERKGPRAITPPREGEKVYENEPEVLEGVVRANDPKDDPILINRGASRNLRDKFTNIIDKEKQPKRRGPRAITPPGGIEDVFENTPDEVPEGCVRSSDSAPKINFQKGKIGSMAEGFIAAAEEANKTKGSRTRIEIQREGVQEVFESNPDESMSDARASDQPEHIHTRGLARDMKGRSMEDVEARRRNVKKTQIVIDHAVQDTFENNPDESHADYKSSDKHDSIPTRGLAKTMTEKFFQEAEERSNRPKRSISPIHRDGIQEVWESTPDQSLADVTYKDNSDPLPTRGLANTMKEKFFQDVETRGKVRKTQIVIDRDGNQEVFENDPEGHFADSYYEEGAESVRIPRGQLGNLKDKFFEDVEQRRGNITKTAVDIPELHGMQSTDVYENTPEESSADVKASLTREERRANRASRGGYAKQMQQQFLQDAEDRQRNIKRTEIDIPREGALQDVFENAPEESAAGIRSGQEIHEVIQTKGLAKTMAMRAQIAAEEASAVKTSLHRLPAPKKFVEYENVGVKAKSKQEYCAICQEPVYRNDRLDLGKFILHEQCFRCLKCGLKLTNSNFATYGDALLCKAHYHQLFQKKGNYTELARTGRYTISGSTERLIENGDITEEEAKQMLLIQAEVDNMVQERRSSNKVEDEDYARGRSYQNDEVMQQEEEEEEEQR